MFSTRVYLRLQKHEFHSEDQKKKEKKEKKPDYLSWEVVKMILK
jgi:hypothetical protein